MLRVVKFFLLVEERMKLNFIWCLQVIILMIDNEIIGCGVQINISWGKGDCYVVVFFQKIVDNVDYFLYMDYVIVLEVFFLVFGGSVGFILLLCMVILVLIFYFGFQEIINVYLNIVLVFV